MHGLARQARPRSQVIASLGIILWRTVKQSDVDEMTLGQL